MIVLPIVTLARNGQLQQSLGGFSTGDYCKILYNIIGDM
jgi:hypothetical protein